MQISVIAVEGKGGHKRLQNNTKSARDCKSGGGKLQKLIMQMHTMHMVYTGHKTGQRFWLNYKGRDFNLDYKYISQEFLMKYHLGGKK